MFLKKGVTAQKMKSSIKGFFSKCDQIRADLVTFTEEILDEKLHFLYSVLFFAGIDVNILDFLLKMVR